MTPDEADDIRYGNLVAVQEVSQHRWYTRMLVVYRDGEALRGFYHLDPATEMQEGQDEYEDDPVPTFPVTAREQVVTVYAKEGE